MAEFESALRDELMAATRRPPRRRGEKLAIAGALVAFTAVLVAVAVSTVSSSPPAAADIDVSHKAGRVIVRLTDLQNTPEGIERATDKAGLDINVEGAPAGPSLVGRFLGSEASEGAKDLHRIEDANGITFVAFSLPEHWPGTLTLYLGRKAKPREPYRQPSNAYAKGEPLACSGTLGHQLRAITGALDGYDVTVVRFGAGGRPGPAVPLSRALRGHLATLRVTGGVSLASDQLEVDVGGEPPQAEEPVEC